MAERILFLDDNPERAKAAKRALLCTHVATAAECIEALKHAEWDAVYLDHDLGGGPDGDAATTADARGMTGMDVVRWLCKEPGRGETRMIVHSLNPIAAAQMFEELSNAGFEVSRVPFTKLLEMWKA